MLWQEIRQAAESGAPLRGVFERMGQTLGRKPNSVRNYYYMQLRDQAGKEYRRAAPFETFSDEDIHQLLTKELSVDTGLRHRRVGITGTQYRPLDNEFQIREAMRDTCALINSHTNVFEKALLVLLLLSYIQPFMDGNKRTARITSNAMLIANGYCPLSFRTVDSIDYKKAINKRMGLRNKIYSIISRDYGKRFIVNHYYDNDRPLPIWAIFERKACLCSERSLDSQSISAFSVTRSDLGTAFWFSLISMNSLICSLRSRSTKATTGMVLVDAYKESE